MASLQRVKKIDELIKRELGKIILREIGFSRNILVTVTGVEVSGNLQQAKVFVSVLPEEETKNVLEVLEKEIYNLQKILDSRLRMRPVPKIKFIEDKKSEEAQRVEKILNNLKNR